MHKSKIILTCRILLPLFLGSIVYLLFRPPLPIMQWLFTWDGALINISTLPNFLSSFILFHFTDILWALSFTETIYILSKNKYLAVIIVTVFTIVFELSQYFGVIAGTGDICDVIYVIAMLIIYLIIMTKRKGPKNEKKDT